MRTIPDFLLPLTHHASFIQEEYFDFRADLEQKVSTLYSYESLVYETLSIDDVRNLRERVILASPTHKEHVYILQAFTIGHDAQHALLKLLEEPRSGVYLIFLVYSTHSLLPTIHSRVALYVADRTPVDGSISGKIPEFYRLSLGERLAFMEKEILKEKKTKTGKTTESSESSSAHKKLLGLLAQLEQYEHAKTKNTETYTKLLEYSRIREQLLSPGASPKILAEYMCFL